MDKIKRVEYNDKHTLIMVRVYCAIVLTITRCEAVIICLLSNGLNKLLANQSSRVLSRQMFV